MQMIHPKWLTLLMCLIIVGKSFSQPISSYTCPPGDNTCKYVFKIIVTKANRGNNEQVTSWTLTGFKVAGVPYIVTALHGIAKGWVKYGTGGVAIYAQNDSDGLGTVTIKYLMNPVYIDRKRDLVYLDFGLCQTPKGLPFDPKSAAYIKEGLIPNDKRLTTEKLTIYGFPSNGILLYDVTQAGNPYKKLWGLLGKKQEEWYKLLTSPDIDGEVVALKPADIQPGNSGSPIIRWEDKKPVLVGVGDGAKLTETGAQAITWAIPFDKKTMNFPETPKEKLQKAYIEEQRQLMEGYKQGDKAGHQVNMDYGLRASEETAVVTTNSKPSRISYAPADPQFTIGGSLSYLYSVDANGFDLQKKPGDRNTFLDLYAEYRLRPWLRMGLYGTSPYLQYELIRSFKHLNLNLFPDPILSSQKGWFKQIGGQVSLAWRGVLWESYVGAGGLPVKIGSFPPNYRFFLGVRHYLVPRRWLAAEARAVWMSPEEIPQLSLPRLGNALITPQTTRLNTIYLCFGFSLSIPHRFRP